ncbi:MAG: hypothetical protein ACFCVE_12245 [Phycisphaerae bacterium]
MRFTLALFAVSGLMIAGCAKEEGQKADGMSADAAAQMDGLAPTTTFEDEYTEHVEFVRGERTVFILASDEARTAFNGEGELKTIPFQTEKGAFRLEGVKNLNELIEAVEKDFGVSLAS